MDSKVGSAQARSNSRENGAGIARLGAQRWQHGSRGPTAVLVPVTLVTIPFSHYCEKARWALDHHRLAFEEDAYAPGEHFLRVRRLRGKTVPILIDGSEIVHDSSAILRHLDARAPASRRLYPDDAAARQEVESIEEELDGELGPTARQWAYFHVLNDARAALALMTRGMPIWKKAAFTAIFPALRAAMKQRMDVQAESAATALERVRAVLARTEARLEGGRRYLVGDRFTAADLTFASLCGPALLLPIDAPWADHPTLPAEMVRVSRELRATPAGAFALRLYREERRPACLGA